MRVGAVVGVGEGVAIEVADDRRLYRGSGEVQCRIVGDSLECLTVGIDERFTVDADRVGGALVQVTRRVDGSCGA